MGGNRDLSDWVHISETSFNFDKFKEIVKQVETKFWAISNKKVGEPFTKNLWSAFYAVYIIPVRAKIYPEIDAKIKERREQFLSQNP